MKNQNTSKQWTRARLIGSIRLKARTPAKKSPLKRATHLRWPMSAQTTTLVAGGLAAAVLFVVWLQPSPRADDRTESLAYNLPGPARAEGNRSRPSSQSPSAPTRTAPVRPAPRTSSLEPAAEADAAPVHATLEGDARPAASVTLTGCLENEGTDLQVEDPATPSVGQGLYYLFRVVGCGGQSVRVPARVGEMQSRQLVTIRSG